MALATIRVDAKLSGVWTTLGSDVGETLSHYHGIDSDGPMDVFASPGQLRFDLDNSSANLGGTLGWYSPGHPSMRAGWGYGVEVRVVYTFSGTDYVCWIGKIAQIDPDTNSAGLPTVHVVAYDRQNDLFDADVRSVDVQIGQTEDAIQAAILDSLPSGAQPLARSIEAGLDSYAFALDGLGSKTKAAAALAEVARSAFGLAFTSRDGTYTYVTRQSRFLSAAVATFTDPDLQAFDARTGLDGVYNVVRLTYHPKHTAAATLWVGTGPAPLIRAGETIAFWVSYRDPNQTNQPIGASAVTSPVAGTDYIAKENPDGTGTTLTGNLTVSVDDWATQAEWTVTNTGAVDAYLTTRQLRGTGIFDDEAAVVESRSAQSYGERVLELDLKYQDNRYISAGLAELIRTQRENIAILPRSLTFRATDSDALMLLALTLEIGDIVGVTNTAVGLTGAAMLVQRIELEVGQGGSLMCSLGLAPTSSLTTPPSAPTGLSVTVTSDETATANWTNSDPSSETEIYVDGVLWAIAAPGATAYGLTDLARAVNHTVTARHIRFALLRSPATAGVVCRPAVSATGGTVTTPGDGFKYHTFTSSSNLVITIPGRISIMTAGGGGGGGGGGANGAADVGGGAGGGGGVEVQIDNIEPAGTHPVVVGAGGSGGATDGTTGNAGTPGTDSSYDTTDVVGRGGGAGGGVVSNNGQAGGNLSSGGTLAGGGGGGGGGAAGGSGGVGFNSTGGSGGSGPGNSEGGGGGGGAAGNGGNATSTGGSAGPALSTFAGSFGAGGIGGRGALGQSAGSANTGTGGGGGNAVTNGFNGGSGKVVIRYPI